MVTLNKLWMQGNRLVANCTGTSSNYMLYCVGITFRQSTVAYKKASK